MLRVEEATCDDCAADVWVGFLWEILDWGWLGSEADIVAAVEFVDGLCLELSEFVSEFVSAVDAAVTPCPATTTTINIT